MRKPSSRLLTACAVVVGVLVAAPQAATGTGVTAGPTEPKILRTPAFSPNGDGVRDVTQVQFRLSQADDVTVAVTRFGEPTAQVRRVSLGPLPAGLHTWQWNGRNDEGRRLDHGTYDVRVLTAHGEDAFPVFLDLEYSASAELSTRYGQPTSRPFAIYPRSRAVRDEVQLFSDGEDTRAVLVVRGPDGKVVLRRDLRKHPTSRTDQDGVWRPDPVVWDARDSRDRPLPPGRYRAVVSGVDDVGNRGSGEPLALHVSRARLSWVTKVRTMSATDTQAPPCLTEGNESCGERWECGTVEASAQRPGALSHRAGVCRADLPQQPPLATSRHFVPVAAAVRGIDALRLSFTGAATVAGESDTGTLRYWTEDKSGTSRELELTSDGTADTPWFAPALLEDGRPHDPVHEDPRVPPGAYWQFQTTDTDSFDVSRFTVGMRYLAVRR